MPCRANAVSGSLSPSLSPSPWSQAASVPPHLSETQAFRDGDKRILVFSDAGGTGRSYHADHGVKNQRKRVQHLLEPGWRGMGLFRVLAAAPIQAQRPCYGLARRDALFEHILAHHDGGRTADRPPNHKVPTHFKGLQQK